MSAKPRIRSSKPREKGIYFESFFKKSSKTLFNQLHTLPIVQTFLLANPDKLKTTLNAFSLLIQ